VNDPAKPDTPTKEEHDAWVALHGRPYTQRPLKRRRPKEITDMPASAFSIIDGYVNEGEGK
jgi:hypothetical protein